LIKPFASSSTSQYYISSSKSLATATIHQDGDSSHHQRAGFILMISLEMNSLIFL